MFMGHFGFGLWRESALGHKVVFELTLLSVAYWSAAGTDWGMPQITLEHTLPERRTKGR